MMVMKKLSMDQEDSALPGMKDEASRPHNK